MDRLKRFINSKCDRCGKATPARQNGEHDLYVLPHEWGAPLAEEGGFCADCIGHYSREDWLAWWIVNRGQPSPMEGAAQFLAHYDAMYLQIASIFGVPNVYLEPSKIASIWAEPERKL